jgi:hypothetical protein
MTPGMIVLFFVLLLLLRRFWAQVFVLLLGAMVGGPVGYAFGGNAQGVVVGVVVCWLCLIILWAVDESGC